MNTITDAGLLSSVIIGFAFGLVVPVTLAAFVGCKPNRTEGALARATANVKGAWCYNKWPFLFLPPIFAILGATFYWSLRGIEESVWRQYPQSRPTNNAPADHSR